MSPDAAADASATAIAQRWAAVGKNGVPSGLIEEMRAGLARWAKNDALTFWYSGSDENDAMMSAVAVAGLPTRYGMGVARGPGKDGDDIYYSVAFFAKGGE